MHDSKGREIHEGDFVAANDWTRGNDKGKQKRSVFKVTGLVPGSESCNMYVQPFTGLLQPWTVTAKETELVLLADGSTPPAPAA